MARVGWSGGQVGVVRDDADREIGRVYFFPEGGVMSRFEVRTHNFHSPSLHTMGEVEAFVSGMTKGGSDVL